MPKNSCVSSSSSCVAGLTSSSSSSSSDSLHNHDQCKYCLERLRGYCAVCVRCRGVTLCFRCLAWGVEGGSHLKEHPYRLLAIRESAAALAALAAATAAGAEPTSQLFIFEDELDPWTCDEEIRLIDSIDVFGVGNWHDVAEQVGGGHSPDECVAHYGRFYLRGALGRALLPITRIPCRVRDHTTPLGAPLSPSLYQTLPSTDMGLDEQQLLGFMPNRDDFERDYDNDAESILCKLSPTFEEDELDNALKVAQIDIYTHRLRERQRRKNIARKHGLIPRIMAAVMATTITNSKKSGSTCSLSSNSSSIMSAVAATTCLNVTPSRNRRLERYDAFNIDDKFKAIVRYLEPDEGRQFFEGISREAKLRKEIAMLAEKRRKGMQKLTGSKPNSVLSGNQLQSHLDSHSKFSKAQESLLSIGSKPVLSNANYSSSSIPICGSGTVASANVVSDYSSLGAKPNLHGASNYHRLLSTNESLLCSRLRLSPEQYLILKTHVLLRRTSRTKAQLQPPSSLVATVVDSVSDFLRERRWLPPE